jgi:HK97 family phage major capsid protein
MLSRAWATLNVKSLDDEQRLIEGLVTTPTPDRRGDIVEPTGAEFTLPMPLLWQHDQHRPVGEVLTARVTPAGIAITAKFATVDVAGTLRDRLDEAWHSVKARLVRGLSIGFQPLEAIPVKGSRPDDNPFVRPPMHIKRWQWAETSAVTIPMNVEATITNIKSAALGHPSDPGVTGLPVVRVKDARTMKPTYTEQIGAHEATRGHIVAQMAEVMETASDATLDADQTARYDTYAAQVKSLDGTITRLREMETLNATLAKPIAPAIERPALPHVQVKSTVPKGQAFVRLACATLVCHGNRQEAAEYAKRWDDSTPEVSLALKAAIAPGTITDATWAGPLVNQTIVNDFLELLRPATVLGKIPGLRTVPFNCKIPSQTAGGTYGWVGEAKPKPVTKLTFSAETLAIAKAAGIIVLTEELVRLSNPSAEALVRQDMIAGIAQFLDQQFLDPAVAAVAGVNPASITNGAATAVATTNPLADIMGLINHFVTNNIAVEGVTFVMSPANALSLSFRTNLDGSPEFPGIGIGGGTYRGLNFVTSGTAGTNVIALQPALVLYADEGGVTVDASREASIQMDSAPASPADATTVLVSLWQMNCVGLRAERFVNWKRVGTNSVKYLTAAAWPAPTGVSTLRESNGPSGRSRPGAE